MEYAIIAYDGTDEGALERRLAVREAHMRYAEAKRAEGYLIHGGAILDDAGKMIGSLLVCEFPTQEAFDTWYNNDPYVTGNVWQSVQVLPFRTAPPFIGNILKPVSASASA